MRRERKLPLFENETYEKRATISSRRREING
jgi:hypothetical protein